MIFLSPQKKPQIKVFLPLNTSCAEEVMEPGIADMSVAST